MSRPFLVVAFLLLPALPAIAQKDSQPGSRDSQPGPGDPEPRPARGDAETEFLEQRVHLLGERLELREAIIGLRRREAEVDGGRFERELEVAKASLEEAKARIVHAQRDLERTEQLRIRGVVDEGSLDSARRGVASAKRELLEREATIAGLRGDIDATKVRTERADLEARLELIDARLELAEAEFRLRQRRTMLERFRRGRFLDRDASSDSSQPSSPFQPRDPTDPVPPREPRPDDRPLDPDADVDVRGIDPSSRDR